MKTKILLTLVAVLSIASCKKDSEKTSMSATIDGKSWNSIVRVSELETTTQYFIITGTSATGEILAITIKGSTVGTYELTAGELKAQCLGSYKASPTVETSDIYVSSLGTVELTEVNKATKTISGTFSFTLRKNLTDATKSVTKGVFNNLSYVEKAQ